MKKPIPCGRTVACGNETARATPVLLLVLALLGTSAPAITVTWDGGSLGDSDVLEKLSLDTQSGNITFDNAVRPNPNNGTPLPLSSGGPKVTRPAITFGAPVDFTFRRILSGILSGIPSPLPYEDRAGVRPGGGMLDSAGGILAANNQNEHMIGALSLTANSTLDLHAGEGATSLRFAAASTAVTSPPINGSSNSADKSGPDDNIFIIADAATSGAQRQIEFTSDAPGATLSGRLIMPVPEPINVALGVFGAGFVVFGIGRRLRAQAQVRRQA